MTRWRGWVSACRARLIAQFGGRCWDCGLDPDRESGVVLEFAHRRPTGLKGRGRGSFERLRDVSRHRDRYRLLCPSCHDRRDGRATRWRPPAERPSCAAG